MGKPKKKVKTLPTLKLSFDQTEQMLNIIQKNPVLYDPTHTDYHHRTITFQCLWESCQRDGFGKPRW